MQTARILQRKLLRRARYCAPIAERKPEAAEVGCHPALYLTSWADAAANCFVRKLRNATKLLNPRHPRPRQIEESGVVKP